MEHTVTSEAPSLPHKKTGINKNIVYLLAFGIFGIITTEFGVIGILPQLAAHFKVSISTAGWLLTAFALTIAIFGPFITLAAGGINRKIALSGVLIIFILSNLLSIIASSFPILMIARILPAFFHPIFFSVAMATAAQSVAPSEAPKAVSIVFSGVSIGTVLGVPISVFFADLYGWEAAFIVCSIVNLIPLISLLILLPSMPVKEKFSFGSQLSILKNAKIWWNITIVTVFMAGMSASYGYMAEYLKEVVQMSGKAISLTMFLFGVAGVFGNLLMGRLLSINMVRSVWQFFAGIIIVQVILYFISGLFYPAAAIVLLWGFVMTSGYLLGQTLITSAAPKAPEFASSLFVSSGNMGFAIGPVVGGLALETLGVSSLPLVSVGIIAIAACMFFLEQFIYNKPKTHTHH
ncbi:Predicted arabinose efflux permease, MFS family [Chitinophaga sp. YR627]|uniref:MFS transporter n=1 Tax=Chitinophaga sp. YR627 TaxID=1881041 RepID=UPI0008EEAD04|nr:MFS transporter [Chitinophaga sp. YR627]SFO27907.1 Predicted arabinose efflux permease, MFS family [Chitinophaga sp. YR627]